ncbi:MAG: cation-translocating P-type ATPase [Cetobacterium sp.]
MKVHFEGLSSIQVEESRKKFGDNNIIVTQKESFFQKLVGTFTEDPIIKILVIALLVEAVFFFLGYVHWYEPLGIAIAVGLATMVGTWSEYSSENQFQELQEKASQIKCKVFRNGKIQEVLIGDLVKGDYILLQPGDKVPVDGVLKLGKLKISQVSLNGETEPVKKEVAQHNFDFESTEFDKEDSPLLNPFKVFRESVVEDGNGVIEAIKVGKNTLTGSVNEEEKEEIDSPLKFKLNKLADGISKFGYIGGSLIALAFMLNKAFLHPNLINGASKYFSILNSSQIIIDIVQAIILAVIIIVVAVPEGLPMMIAIVLSLNMKKLLTDNILVRKLIGIETAGSLNILFSDKTGTITEGKLSVVNFLTGNGKEHQEYKNIPSELKNLLKLSLSINTDAILDTNSKGESVVIGGNITEKALLNYISEEIFERKTKIINKIPFNSTNKFVATEITGDLNLTLLKGAPDKLVEYCCNYYAEDGLKKKLTKDMIDELEIKMHEYAKKSMRVIAVSTTDNKITNEEVDFSNSTLIGILAIRDELKADSKEAINLMEKAGIQVVMITGDRKDTATAIAKDLNLLKDEEDIVLSSKELNQLTDNQVLKIIPNLKVIARALPSDKLRLVKLAQELNLVTGMTGDGVNDSPALERADVGFSMGSGTEIAKESSDIVILDDTLTSIAKTCLYGRTIYKSIQKFIQYQLTVNFAAILIAFLGPFIGFDFPLSMSQMLWVNLIMDTLAAIALGGEPSLNEYLDEKPKKRDEEIISKYMWNSIIFIGSYIVILCIIFLKSQTVLEIFREDSSNKYLLTGFFTFFIFLNAFNIFNVRSTKLNILEHIKSNQNFIKVVIFIFVLQIVMVYFGGNLLRTYGLLTKELIFVTVLAFTIIPFDFMRKKIFKNKF